MNYYVTPKDYETAKQNGISEKRVYARVYMHGWNIDRAINEKVRKKTCRKHWVKVAKNNGISYKAFHGRLHRGMSEEEAATKPTMSKQKFMKLGREERERQRKYPDWVYDNAKKNGINQSTLWARINRHGWTLEDASTIKPMKRGEKRKGNTNHIWRTQEKARIEGVEK